MNITNPTQQQSVSTPALTDVCLASCKKLGVQIQKTKNAILKEFVDAFKTQEHLLRLALNEAEALAWQTGFPQLVFPTLATEKAQAALAWSLRQRSMNRSAAGLGAAA